MQILPPPSNNFTGYFSPRTHKKPAQSYQEYYMQHLKDKNNQRQKRVSKSVNKHNPKQKIRKQHKKKNKGNNKKTKRPKINKKDYEINPMYASRISQMISDISVPHLSPKVTKSQLKKLESKISTEILALRQQKIIALENLNRVTDKKNKVIELIRRIAEQRQNQKQLSNSQNENNTISANPKKLSKTHYKNNDQYKSLSNLNSYKMQKEIQNMASTLNQAQKIRQELMEPLIDHPLNQRNEQLHDELQILKQQLVSLEQSSSKSQIQINRLKKQNILLQQQLQKQKQKLSKIQKNRFETFFPQDKKKLDEINSLLTTYEELQRKKQNLSNQTMHETIIRKADDEIIVQELKQQNKSLMEWCNRFLNQIKMAQDDQLQNLTLQELQNMVHHQESNKRNFIDILEQFRQKVNKIDIENQLLRKKSTRISYYY